MTTPKNVLLLVDLLARLNSAEGTTPVVTDHDEALLNPATGILADADRVAEMTVAAVSKDASDVQTAASMADLFSPYSDRAGDAISAGLRSPVVIAPYGDAARWVTDISYGDGRFTLHTMPM